MLHAKHALIRVSGGMPPPLQENWNLGSLRVQLLAIHISVVVKAA